MRRTLTTTVVEEVEIKVDQAALERMLRDQLGIPDDIAFEVADNESGWPAMNEGLTVSYRIETRETT